MCASDTREIDVDRFLADLEHLLVHASRESPPEPVDHRKL